MICNGSLSCKKKVLNNNVLIAIIDDEEVILIGKGIGFNRKKRIAPFQVRKRKKYLFLKMKKNKEAI